MSHMLPADLYLRPLPFLDGKWLRADLIGSLRHHDDAAILWNNLIQDCELVSSPAGPILNSAGNLSYLGDDGKHYCGMQRLACSCCQNDYCGPLSACNCPPCHTLDSDSAIKKMTTCSQNSANRRVSSDVIFESWLWGHAPSTAAKQHCQRTLISELHDIALQAGGNCLSAIHLRQQLLIYERYFVALARYRQQVERQQQQQKGAAEGLDAGATEKFKDDGPQAKKERFMMGLYDGLGSVSAVKSALRHQASSQAVDTPAESVSSPLGKDFERATIGLARVGTRAALNFTFAFLRRAWRSGEDTEMCSELLSEALESLQDLPEASLFDASQVSQLWIEVLERSMKFLRQVALGDPMGGRCIAPRKDRHVSLCLLLELATQKGTLTAALEAILLLITLWEKEKDLDNDNRAMGHRQNRGAPLVPILRRYAAIGKLHASSSSSPPSAATELESTASSATESFLRFLTLPEQESANVDLKQAAVVIISHLDRLAKPHMIPGGGGGGSCNMLGGSMTKEPKNRSAKVAVKMVPPSPISSLQAQVSQDASVGGATSLESPTGVGPGASSLHEQRIYSLGWQNFGGMQYGFTAEPSVGIQGSGGAGGGAPDTGCLSGGSYQVPVLNFYFQVKQVAISEEYVLFLTHDGKMYQWRCGRPETEPMLIEEMADTPVAQIAAHCEGKHYMALDVCGNAYSWGSRDGAYLGHGDTLPRDNPTKIQKLDRNCKSVHCGAESSAAITFDGALYTWGLGSAILGHGNNENKLLPSRVLALQDYKVVDVALGGYGNSHSLCLTVGGLVFGWGCGAFGMLGDSSNNIVELPVLIEALPRSVMRVFTGPWISLALTSDGRLYTWGRSDDGRLGHGGMEASVIKSITPKPIAAFQSKVIVNVSVGSYHCLALTSGGEVYGWGRNDYQQICPGSVSKEAMISEPILASPPNVYMSGIACGSRQSVIWSQTSVLEVPPAKLPFVIELSEQTFRLLDQLLEIVCGQDVDGRKPPNQESECIAVACLNLLRLQMHSLLANGVSPKAVGLYEGSRLLVSLKTRILRLAGGSSVLKTMQEAAQWTLQVGWSLLMPTAAERAQTLTSLLPAESSYSSSGHRFMTDLLVRSLMAEGGLETALFHTIRSNSRADSSMDGAQTLPLLHLIKQLLRNNSTLTHARLTEIAALKKNGPGHMKADEDEGVSSAGAGGGPSWPPHSSGQSLSPCLELLHRFQRLLFAHVHQATKNEDLSGAETLFAKYFQIAASFSILSLQKAHEIGLKINDCGQLADIMKNDISDTLLFEMIIGLIILKRDRPTILDGFRWTKVFVPLLHALDNFNRIICDSDVQDSDDMGWPGIICRGSRKQRMSSTDESTNVVYEHDVENHIIEGGKWIILNGYVCDVSNYQCNSNALNEIIENGIGKDITAKLNRPIFRRDADCILANLKVGRYAVNDEESKGYPQYTKVVTHLGTERALAYLLGLVCNILQSGPPLQPAELQCKSILKSNILRGGLQLLQPANPFDEEKGEARSSASTAGSTPTDSSAHCIGTTKSGTDSALGLKNIGGTTQQRIDNFIASLSEGRLGEPLVATWTKLVERYCKENNMIWHQNYPSEHPVQELERLLTAVLIRHQSLGGKMISLLQRELSGLDTSKPIREISEMIRLIYQTKWSVIRTRQQLNRSYKEVCAPMLERLRFLLHEVRPAISLEQEGLRKLFILNKLPRFKELVRRIIVDIRTAKKQLACTKPEDIVNVTIQSQNSAQNRTSNQMQEQMQVDLAVSPAANDNEQGGHAPEVVADSNVTEHERKMTASHEDSCCKRQAIQELKFEESKFRNIEEMRKLSERWYFHGELNVALMNEFVEFIMQDVCDVETVRRAMYCQVQRYQLRRHGIEMLNSLVRIQTLLNSVQYNLLNGYLGLYAKTGGISDMSYKLRPTTASIEDDVQSITASQKVSLRLSYSQVLEWCVAELQRLVNQEQVNLKHNKYGTCSGKDNSNLGTYVFLKKLPRARFLLSLFGILAKDMDSNELSLIVNSGTLGMVLGLLSQTGGDVPAVKNTYELSVVYEDVILKQKLNKANLSGPELAKLMKIGTRIVRGADWKWGDQDGNPPGEGRIISEVGEDGWVRVEWYTGGTNSYRMGKEGQYDLRLAESALNIISPDTDNEKDEFSGEAQLNGESHPTKLLRYACTKFLQILSVGIGLQSERMDKNAVRSIASMFRSILDPKSALANICGLDNWTTLGFLKAVADESRSLSTFLTSPTWIYFYIDLLEKPIVREQSVFRKIHCLRLLQTVLVYWASDSDVYQQRMNSLVERLFVTLGRIVLHCPHDWSLQQRLSENKSRVLLTASHSSTIAEEIVTLLRKLHTLPHWNASINSFMSQKLCVAAELLSVEPFEGSVEPMESETVMVMGVLGTIGGCDLRPRVGLQVCHEGSIATICGFTSKGNCLLSTDSQTLDGEFRKISLSTALECADYSVFSLSRLPLNEMLLNSWSVQIYGPGERKESVPNVCDLNLLRSQQMQLAVLNSNCVLYRHQVALRKILKQRSPAFRIYSSAESTTEEDPEGGEPSMSDPDDTQEGEAASSIAGACGGGSLPHETGAGHSNNYGPAASENELLIQSILIRATQPSPVKAIYSYNDLAIAALNCTQVLTSEMYTETNKDKESTTAGSGGVTGSRSAPTPMQPTMVHGEAIYNVAVLNDSAAAAESSEATTDSGRLSGGKNSDLTDSSLITQIIEMGFCRRSVEYALKNLASNSDVTHATPELVVQWLLEHPDVAAKEAHDSDGPTRASGVQEDSGAASASSVMHSHVGPLQGLYDSEPDSDNENSDSSSATVEGSSIQDKASKVRYRTRKDFATNDQYAMYVRSTVTPGMLVRCCKDFEEIKKDDVGTVVVVDTEGLHDLNVQVDWQKHGSTYWVCFVHIEMLEMPRNTIAKGSYVRLRSSPPRKKPSANGHLCGCIGVVTSLNGKEVSVDFPQNPGWKGTVGELECVSECAASGGGACGYANSSGGARGYRGPQTDIVDDWSRCIRSLAVSSNEALAKNLLDPNLDVYWQSSSNSQSKHWIRLEMHENILVHNLAVMVSPSDHSHMPALIVIRVGDSVATLKDYTWISVKNTDTLVTLLADMHQYFPWIEIVIKQCRNNGIQCKVHALYISGRKRSQTDLDLMLMNASFLAYEYEDQLSMDSNHTPCPSTSSGGAFSIESKSLMNERPCTVMVWGLNDKEQLGGLKGSKVKVPTFSQTISRLRPIHIAGGSKSLFIVSQDGKVYACGEGTNGRLGLGVSINVSTPRQIPVLHQYVVKKVAVHSGGKHAMALTLDGKVFSWGEGEDGKLGHGNRLTLDKPKMIEALRSKKIRDIACGSSHSAAITSAGELYTWGLGEYGRLGHGDTCTQLKPKLVAALSGKRVIQVACGSRDAQTLALTDDGLVYSWGDGDFGKLGRGGSEGSSLPQEIDRLSNMGVVQIECGAQFSLALTRSGEVWTWGKGDYYRLGHANDQHVRKPVQVQGLRFCKVIHVAVGALHCLAVTDTGMVYAWGDNDHGQQGSGNTVVNKKPALVVGLDSVNVNRVACGSSHSIAWGMPQTTVDEEKIGPVPFATTKDPLGGSSLGIYETETETSGTTASSTSSADSQSTKASLSEILLSLETNGARQTALNYVLNAMSILQARQLVIAALTSHSRMFLHGGKVDSDVVENAYNSGVGGSGVGGVASGGASVSGIQYGPEKVTYGKDGATESGSMATAHGNDVIEQGGGEGPADDTDPAVHETSPEADYGGPVPPAPPGAYSAFHSLTGSLSLSASVSSAAAQHKQSKMSASAMSVVAATITNEEEIIEDTSVTGLDDFTSLLGETEAKSLVELLKLSVAGRCGPVGTAQTIADTLIALGSNSPSIGAMLLETCITELEDLCTARHSLGKIPKPVIQESPHPYVDNMTTMGHVKIPGAEALRIEFDCQCSTEKRNDPLVIMDGSGRVIAMRSGRDFSQWASEIRIPGDEMRWKFTSDNSVNGWGWRFWVHAIMPTTSVSERGSDRAVLSQPSIALVMALLNERLGGPLNNMSVLLRLAAALAACAHLNSLSTPQRIWALKRLHSVITSKHAPKPQDRLLQPILQPMIPDLLRQYEYEEPQVRSGIHLMHSDYFKTLAALACDMQLDALLPASEIHKWAWFKRYCIAVRVAQSLIKRTPLPRLFCSEVKNKLTELIPQSLGSGGSLMNSMGSLTSSSSVSSHQMIPPSSMVATEASTSHQAGASTSSFVQTPSTSNVVQYIDPLVAMTVPDGAGSSTAGSIIIEPPLKSHQLLHEDHDVFKAEHDLQLLQWLNRRPDDWELSWGGASTIYGWGHNHRGQLGGLEGSRIKTPTPCEALSLLRPVQLAGGEQTLFAVTPDGKLFATGYGSGGRLGVGGTDSWAIPTLAGSLQHVFVKKVAVNSGGKHCLALTTDGEVYSWGEGEDGKLGHGNRVSYDRPKLIEDLNGIGIVDIACGSAHSAAITSSGHVLTWGKGRYGRLGHGDSEDQLRPKLVEALLGYRAVDIACGSGDAQTLCITDDDNVWSWGDGDYGKLGRGGSDGCKLPYKIESLAGLGVIKVECGSQFSVALTKSGAVYTWGKGDFHRLGHGSVDHVRRPKKVAALQSKKIISIATGSLHCVACSDTGEVYTWGDNDEGQLGDGTVSAIQRPRLVAALQGKHIVKVTCGSAHTLALSTTTLSDKVRPPPSPPLEYDLVRELPPEALHARLILLHHFSELLCPCLAMLPITGDLSLGALKDVVVYSIKEAAFRKVIQTTMMRDKQHGPVIELNRIQVKRSRCKSGNGLAGVDGMKSVFGQMVQKLPLLTQESLSLPHRVWKVKFVGESVDDCGGGYSESIAEMCDELQNGSVPLLITTPNGRGEAGANRDCFLLDPTLTSVLQMNMFRFLGVLMGIAVRTGSPLSLNLAEPVWRQLAGEQLRPSDLTEVDRDYVAGLLCIRNMDDDPKFVSTLELPFSTSSAKGYEVPLSTRFTRITAQNRHEYVRLALNFRLHEFDEQVKAVRDGMSKVIPVPLLSLFSAAELQAMVCGSPDIPLGLLKSVATYKGFDLNSPQVIWFWEVMEDFTNQERSLFLRFVWGRTRLPRTIADFRGRDFVLQVLEKFPPDHFLPESYTCFFLLKMPRYTCKAVLLEKLKYAIHFCKSIDTDEYARVAMGDPTEATGSEDDSDMESVASRDV